MRQCYISFCLSPAALRMWETTDIFPLGGKITQVCISWRKKKKGSLLNDEAKTWVDFNWKHSHGGNPPTWFAQKDSCSHRSYSIEQGEPLTKKTCGPSPTVPSRAIPRYSNLNSRLPTGFGSHHPCCVLWAAGALFTLRLLSHRNPVLKLSEDGCYRPFKKNSREVSEVHPTAGKCPLGSTLSSRYTLLPPRYASKVSSEFIPKWFLQSDHVDEAVCNFYWRNIIPSAITFIPFCHTSPPTLALRSYIASWS